MKYRARFVALLVVILLAVCGGRPAMAQLATPVLPGTLSTTNCPSINLTPCFVKTGAQAYQLLLNATASGGTFTNVAGGQYQAQVFCSAFNGATISLQSSNADGSFTAFATYTSSGATPATGTSPYTIGQGSSVRAVISGGTPSGCNATLEGL